MEGPVEPRPRILSTRTVAVAYDEQALVPPRGASDKPFGPKNAHGADFRNVEIFCSADDGGGRIV